MNILYQQSIYKQFINPQIPQMHHAFFSTLFVYASFLMTVGIVSRIKEPMARQFDLSESVLGFLDGISFIGGFLGYLSMGIFPLKQPVRGLAIMSVLLFISMESIILSKIIVAFRVPLLAISRLFCGFFRSYFLLPYIILNYYTKNDRNHECMIQIWYSCGLLGDVLGIVIPQILMNYLGFDWAQAMTLTLLLLLFSAIYLLITVPQFRINQNYQESVSHIQFLCTYWRNGLNFLHSMILVISSVYYMMIIWLPYVFVSLGFKQNGSLISIAYPIAYMLSGFLFQPIQAKTKNYLGILFLVVLITNSILSILLVRLGDDPQDIPEYIILLFGCSFLISGFNIFTQTVDLNHRANNSLELVQISSLIGCSVQIFYGSQMLLSGLLLEKNLQNVFVLYFVLTGCCLLLHIIRLLFYPNSFSQNESNQQRANQRFEAEELENSQ